MMFRFVPISFQLLVSFFLTVVPVFAETITVRENETRQVEYIELDNGLRVLLIEDAGAKKAAVSLDVYVGSGEDPIEFQGLAHFLEHMLFLGSKKFPKVDDFSDYISGHSGTHNAFTSLKHTNYFFDIDANFLSGALDRFSSMIAEPLLDSAYIDREINAVHSEFTSRYKNEFRRQRDVLSELIPVGHPLSRFSTGNLETLSRENKAELRQALVNFYNKYYHALNMTLVVNSPLPYSESSELVSALFGKVSKAKKTRYTKYSNLFEPNQLPARVYLEPHKEVRSLTMLFPMEYKSSDLYRKPLHYIGHILGHEGQGSLLSELKALGWVTSLSAGQGLEWRGGEAFNVTVQLTKEGSQELEEIERRILNRISLIKTHGVKKWRYQELEDVAKINFEFADVVDPVREVTWLASRLQEHKPKNVFVAPYKYSRFSSRAIHAKLKALNAENYISFITLPKTNTNKVSKIYRVPYRVEKIIKPIVVSNKYYSSDSLPRKNSFIPTNFDILNSASSEKTQQAIPSPLSAQKDASNWYAQDTVFKSPKLLVKARYILPGSAANVEGFVHTQLIAKVIREQLNEIAYEALLSGLSYKISANSRGLSLEFKGYSDSLPRLTSYTLNQIHRYLHDNAFQSRVNDEHFSKVYEKYLRDSRNRLKGRPSSRLFDGLPSLLYSPYWSAQEILTVLESASRKEYEQSLKSLFHGGKLKSLTFGNVDKEKAHNIAEDLSQLIDRKGSEDIEVPAGRVVKLEAGSGQRVKFVSSEENDVGLLVYYQGADDSYESRATTMVVEQIVGTPFYTSLRTEQQLGYIVQTGNYPIKDVPGIVGLIQSPTAESDTILTQIDAFFRNFEDRLFDNFERDRSAVLTSLREPFKNQSEQANDFWSNIVADKTNFDERSQLIRAVSSLTKKDVLDFYRNTILGRDRSFVLVAQNTAVSKDSDLMKMKHVDDFSRLKSNSKFYTYP